MDFSDAASGGEESSGGYGGGALPPPRRLSSLPTLAEDSVGGGSRSTRTRSPSPSVGTLAAGGGGGGGSRTASGAEGGSAAGLPPQHPTSSGERERGGGREEGAFSRGTPRCLLPRSITSLTLLLTAGRRSRCRRCGIRGETERRRDFFSRFQKTRGGRARENAPEEKPNLDFFPSKKKTLSHSRWDSYFDSKRKVSVPGRGRFCVYQRGGVVSAASNPNSSASSNSAFAAASSSAAGGGDTAVSPAPPWGASTSEQQQLQLPVVFCHHGAGYTGLSWALVAAQMGPG